MKQVGVGMIGVCAVQWGTSWSCPNSVRKGRCSLSISIASQVTKGNGRVLVVIFDSSCCILT